ncbi:calpain-9-like [Physella acuta]|uniref:calpain-9-like n=1 Tax=Physella acuta TaxID=109671 RepID=UPI0027DE8F96|nr:calpain-9-like [Physella acuta]
MQYFTDKDFPPNIKSLSTTLATLPPNAGSIEWRRPWMIEANPKFIVEDASRHDIDQGELGNCWFLASAAALATHHQQAFDRVVPRDQYFHGGYTGKFRFNFFLNGGWREVVVDDYLPTRDGKLMYCSNTSAPNEFWPCLLEKAYAKAKGSYANLDGGEIKIALEDLTGCLVQVEDIRQMNFGTQSIYDLLRQGHDARVLMVAGIYPDPLGNDDPPNGLLKGHAYSVTGLRNLVYFGKVIHLIRLRNPWGKGEWNGNWSDSFCADRLTEQQKLQLEFHLLDDGEFWMEFHEFVKNFDQINICHLPAN